MYHFIYKTTSKSGKYYIGRHSTKKLDDYYFGSGKWIRSLKNKDELTREILLFCEESELKEKEQLFLQENVGKENCMNFNLSSCGFSSGKLNPAHTEKEKIKRSIRFKGINNPSKRPEVRKKMSDAHKGKPSPIKGMKLSDEAKKNMADARVGLKFSEEGRKKLSWRRKQEYAEGLRKCPSFSGGSHSDETKKRMSEKSLNLPKIKCIHCNYENFARVIARWHNNNCKLKINV